MIIIVSILVFFACFKIHCSGFFFRPFLALSLVLTPLPPHYIVSSLRAVAVPYYSFLVDSWCSGHGYNSVSQKVAAVPTATHC